MADPDVVAQMDADMERIFASDGRMLIYMMPDRRRIFSFSIQAIGFTPAYCENLLKVSNAYCMTMH